MVYYDDSGRRIHRPVKRRTPPVVKASDDASKGSQSPEPEKPAPSKPKKEN